MLQAHGMTKLESRSYQMELVKEPTATTEAIRANSPAASVVNIQLCVKHLQPMRQVTRVMAIQNRGLEGDRHAMPDSSRQVLLLEQETCIEYDIPVGALRENITTRGIDLMSLPKGTHLQIGDAVFETTVACAPCSFVDSVKPGLREQLEKKRGMLARVVSGGELGVGSKVTILQK
jgi:MOSC domain-containing protein YiiM